jgi:hypothetical protein
VTTSRSWAFLFILSAVATAPCAFFSPAFAQQLQVPAPQSQPAVPQPSPGQQIPGNINGTVLDPQGNPIVGARVTLTHGNSVVRQAVRTGNNGEFSFASIPPGPFHVVVSAPPFADQDYSGTLVPGQNFIVPSFTLLLATINTTVRVQPQAVIAEQQLKQEEQQRVLGVIPNFYVTYVPNAAPLNAKQKFELSWKNAIDPVTLLTLGVTAGIQQANNDFPGYGQGAAGFGKRFGASYAGFATSTFLGSVVFPAILKQDPRYFYKSTGSKRQRVLYAIANAVICKGDNGHWQPNYSNVLGNLASGAIANKYYPPENRVGVALTFELAGVEIAATAAENVIQEFLVPKFTPHKPKISPNGTP